MEARHARAPTGPAPRNGPGLSSGRLTLTSLRTAALLLWPGLALLVAASGCTATRLTPAGRAVRLTPDPEAVRACTRVATVYARRELNRPGYASSEEDVLRRLRNSAGAVGANTVLFDPNVPITVEDQSPELRTDRVPEDSPQFVGVAYSCPPAQGGAPS